MTPKPHRAYSILLCFIIALSCALPYPARAIDDFDKTYREYLNLYASQGKDEQFYALSQQIKQHYLERGEMSDYYRIEVNEAMYDSEHHSHYQAIRKMVELLNKMKENNYSGMNLVYVALGNIFESSGNQNVAKHYYEEAIAHTNDHDDRLAMDAYSRMANLLKLSNPKEARLWNEKYVFLSNKSPEYHQVYLYINAVIAFAEGNKADFLKAKDEYDKYHQANSSLSNYGMQTINIMSQAFAGNYAQALAQLNKANNEIGLVMDHDMRIIIHEMQGNLQAALQASKARSQCIDSLNASLQMHNIREIATETQLAKTKAEAASEHMRMLTIVLVLAILLIGLLIFFNYRRQKDRQSLKKKNEQLVHALSMAEESDKMKNEFVRSVSHEIRTPLNAITGFTDIITTPGMELPEEERQDFINRINDNVKAITKIVDDMLKMSEQSSTDYYPRTGSIQLNQFLSQLIYSYRDKVSSKIELRYTTRIMNRFTLQSNQNGLKQVLEHLIENAIKFTQAGSIELNCQQPDPMTISISLTDTGKGIPEDQREKIFEQFYKVDSFEQGMGLGLTVSKKIAQKLGGDLTIDPDYTDGARFILTLPVE